MRRCGDGGSPRRREQRHCYLTDSVASTNLPRLIRRVVDLAWRLVGFVTNRHE